MKTKTKRWANLFKTGVAMMAILVLASCGHSTKFTKRSAERAIEELPNLQDSAQVAKLTVGYFEENSADARYKLRQLAANEMLTYSAEQINEYYSSWYGEKVEPHVFVTVALTEKGRKYIVNEPIKDKDAKELEGKKDTKVYPEATVSEAESVPVRNPQPPKDEPERKSSSSNSNSYNNSYSSSAPAKEKTMYQLANERVNTSSYYMLSHKVEIVKVKDLLCTEEMMKEGKASCSVILEVADATPFGRILSGVSNGDRKEGKNIKFNFYIDKGWRVAE